jgi:Fe-S oxidoreductase
MGNRVKAKQIAGIKADVVISPCHNCLSGLEDIVSHYKLGTHVHFISDILYEVMEKPG